MLSVINQSLEDTVEKGMATHSRILAWRIHGQRSMVGYRPWGQKELDMTKQLVLLVEDRNCIIPLP